jgi:hypothetical protein
VACLSGIGAAAVGDSGDLEGAYGVVSACFSCLMVLWGFVIAAASPAIIIRFAESGQFNAGFQFGEIFSFISANVGNYIIVIILMWVAGLIASLGVILCVIGVIFTQFWSYLVAGNLMGQLAGPGQPAELAVSDS